jgi:hypothetical protein
MVTPVRASLGVIAIWLIVPQRGLDSLDIDRAITAGERLATQHLLERCAGAMAVQTRSGAKALGEIKSRGIESVLLPARP